MSGVQHNAHQTELEWAPKRQRVTSAVRQKVTPDRVKCELLCPKSPLFSGGEKQVLNREVVQKRLVSRHLRSEVRASSLQRPAPWWRRKASSGPDSGPEQLVSHHLESFLGCFFECFATEVSRADRVSPPSGRESDRVTAGSGGGVPVERVERRDTDRERGTGEAGRGHTNPAAKKEKNPRGPRKTPKVREKPTRSRDQVRQGRRRKHHGQRNGERNQAEARTRQREPRGPEGGTSADTRERVVPKRRRDTQNTVGPQGETQKEGLVRAESRGALVQTGRSQT